MKNVASTELNEVVRYLKRELSGVNGVEIEHKGLSLAIHYRNAIDSQQALRAIQAVVLHLPVEMRQVGGKSVLNLLPKDAPHKGDALRALREESGAIRALYVGDDVTDEDVFKIRQPSWLLTVRIGSFVQSDATYYLHEQSEIDRLLDALILFKTGFKMNTSSGKAR
jgi:trehalose 6-phosphate phosphatase